MTFLIPLFKLVQHFFLFCLNFGNDFRGNIDLIDLLRYSASLKTTVIHVSSVGTWACHLLLRVWFCYCHVCDVLWVTLINPSRTVPNLQNASRKVFGFALFVPFVHVYSSVLSVMSSSIKELVACGNSDWNMSTTTLALPIATPMSSILSNCASTFRRMPVWYFPRSVHLTYVLFCLNFNILCKLLWILFAWSNVILCQYVCCFLMVLSHELNLFSSFSFWRVISGILFIIGSK